jgi:hypothetical protein
MASAELCRPLFRACDLKPSEYRKIYDYLTARDRLQYAIGTTPEHIAASRPIVDKWNAEHAK